MTRSILLALIALVCVPTINALNAFTIYLPYETKQCFYENLKKGDRMDVSFQVSSGGNADINFVVMILIFYISQDLI